MVWARPGGDRGGSSHAAGELFSNAYESGAGSLLRRGARDVGELRLVKLYEAMEYLEKSLDDKAWLVRRYRRTLQGDTRNENDEKRKRRRLGLMAREIERVCVETIVGEMNELAAHYRANKPKIDWLRRVLELVRWRQ